MDRFMMKSLSRSGHKSSGINNEAEIKSKWLSFFWYIYPFLSFQLKTLVLNEHWWVGSCVCGHQHFINGAELCNC